MMVAFYNKRCDNGITSHKQTKQKKNYAQMWFRGLDGEVGIQLKPYKSNIYLYVHKHILSWLNVYL